MPIPGPDSRTLPVLADHLRRIGAAGDKATRTAEFAALAAELDQTDTVETVLGRLIARGTDGQRFALEIAAHLPVPLRPGLIPPLVDLLEQAAIPTRLRVAVAAQVIRSLPPEAPEIGRIIEGFRQGVAPARAVRRLRRLAALLEPIEPIARALGEADAGSATACPRCGARLSPEDLPRHLWDRHQLIWEAGRVREPWDAIGQWVAEYTRTNRAEYLDRSCDLAQALDPTGGLSRVHRLLLLGGAEDAEAHALLRAEATERCASLCPYCFTLVPQPTRATPGRVLVGAGRVEGGGFRVEVTDCYLYTRLEIAAPDAVIHAGPEPGHALTRRGAVLLFLVPLIGAAGIFAVLPPIQGVPVVMPVAGLLFAAVMAYLAITLTWHEADDPTDRAVDHAWALLVPRLNRVQVKRPDAEFLAGLAAASHGRGDPEVREHELRRVIGVLKKDPVGVPYLTPLVALRIADAMTVGTDALPLIAEEVGTSLAGSVPLDHAECLVNELRGDPTDSTRRARLRVLILARAFAAGLEAEDLRILGQLFPGLGAVYASEDREGLARLRLLWLYKPLRLWQKIGSATTVFDLARYPTLADIYLRQRPDLLLFQATGGTDGAAPILICEEGVVYRDLVITDPGVPIKVRARTLIRGGGYELIVGDRTFKFRDDPTLLARRLKGWSLFLFDEFLPRARLLARRRSEHGDVLMLQKASRCPECKRSFLALTGEIGLASVPPATEGVSTVAGA